MKKMIISVVLLCLFLMGCAGTNVEGTKVVREDAPNKEIIQTEKLELVEEKELQIFRVGDRAVFSDEYALTFLSVKETEERNTFSEEDVAQVVEIVYLYENMNLDKDLYISEMDFNFIDGEGNMIKTYPLEGKYELAETPKGAKNVGSFHLGTKGESKMIKALFTDNWFSSNTLGEFELQINEEKEMNLEGALPDFDKVYSVGDIIEVSTSKGDYTLSIDQVRKTKERNSFSEKDPSEVYIIEYTYSNISLVEPLMVSEYDFHLIDENGTMGFHYPGNIGKYPLETVMGARCQAQMVLASHTASSSLILSYRDNFFSDQADIFIAVDNIQD